ncbi:MAG: PEP/pyruvate-binding domain-containing protein [Myxococcales bacterium]|nr:PEP/pyruvate-binding domain-containing protein [Myxococcales bacterium]
MSARSGAVAWAVLLPLWAALGCGDEGAPESASDPSARSACLPALRAADAGGDAGAEPASDASVVDAPQLLHELASAADFAALASAAGEVKFFVPVAGASAPPPLDAPCSFQNTGDFPYHLQFLQSLGLYRDLDLAGYEALTTSPEARQLWAGALRFWPVAPHPSPPKGAAVLGVLSVALYTSPSGDEQPSAEQLAAIHGALVECLPYASERLALLPAPGVQAAAVAEMQAELGALGVFVIELAELATGLGAEVYSQGESYGFVRVLWPREDGGVGPQPELGPRDILVADNAPPELPTLAGLISRRPQSPGSHLNLRMMERGAPSASLPTIFDSALLQQLDGLVAHIYTEDQDVRLEAASLQAAEAHWRRTRPPAPALQPDFTLEALADFAALRASDGAAYGQKAAYLGELQRALPAAQRPAGFAIPLARYQRFMIDNGLQTQVEALLEDPEVRRDGSVRRSRLSQLRDAIEHAPLPAGLLDELRGQARDSLGRAAAGAWLRLRSSSNAEDLAGFSGAGLYDSQSGCFADDFDADALGPSACLGAEERAALEAELGVLRAELAEHPERAWLAELIDDRLDALGRERGVARALRRVWASLWSERAFEDRQWRGLDPRAVGMGVAVHRRFVFEQLDAVLQTPAAGAGDGRYRLISQPDGHSPVRPERPDLRPEVLSFEGTESGARSVQRVAGSSLLEAGQWLWSDAQLSELAQWVFALRQHLAGEVFCSQPLPALEIELERDAGGIVVFKQVRPRVQTQ